jgi:hypothetical protein
MTGCQTTVQGDIGQFMSSRALLYGDNTFKFNFNGGKRLLYSWGKLGIIADIHWSMTTDLELLHAILLAVYCRTKAYCCFQFLPALSLRATRVYLLVCCCCRKPAEFFVVTSIKRFWESQSCPILDTDLLKRG